jgi:hypothetical protein
MSVQKRKDTPLLAVAAKLSAGKNKSRAAHLLCGSASLLRQAERLQRWPIDSRSKLRSHSWIGTPPTLRVFAIRGIHSIGPQRGNDRFVNG